jgi:hypothetical protein
MGALDQQLMVKNEVTYGTAVTPDRTFEFNSESISDSFGRTEGDPLRVGTYVKRNDRFTPYYAGASGTIELDVMTKGFGWWLKQMLGNVATTGPTETTVYTHTGTMADLIGTAFTAQVARPFHPSGTVQAFTFEGGKVASWELANSVENNLVATTDDRLPAGHHGHGTGDGFLPGRHGELHLDRWHGHDRRHAVPADGDHDRLRQRPEH